MESGKLEWIDMSDQTNRVILNLIADRDLLEAEVSALKTAVSALICERDRLSKRLLKEVGTNIGSVIKLKKLERRLVDLGHFDNGPLPTFLSENGEG